MLSLFKSCARLEQLFSARPISASGRTFAPAIPQVDGADVAAKQKILTPSIAIPVALAQARAQPQARAFALQRWARKQMARWFALHLRTDLKASSRPSASSADPELFRLLTARTRPVPWRAPCTAPQSFAALCGGLVRT